MPAANSILPKQTDVLNIPIKSFQCFSHTSLRSISPFLFFLIQTTMLDHTKLTKLAMMLLIYMIKI